MEIAKMDDKALQHEKQRLTNLTNEINVKFRHLGKNDPRRNRMIEDKIAVDQRLSAINRELKVRNVAKTQNLMGAATAVTSGINVKVKGSIDRADMTVIMAMHALVTSGKTLVVKDKQFVFADAEPASSLKDMIEDAFAISERMWPDDYESDEEESEPEEDSNEEDEDDEEEPPEDTSESPVARSTPKEEAA